NEMSVPQHFKDILLHVAAGDEPEGFRYLLFGVVGKADLTEQLFLGVEGSRRVVETVFVAIGQDAPLSTRNGRVAEYLSNPFAIRKGFTESLRLDEQPRLAQQVQGVVYRLVLGGRLELPVYFVGIANIPPQGFQHRLNEGGFGVLLAKV